MPLVVHGRGDEGVVALEEVADGEDMVGLRGVDLRLGTEVAFGEQLDGGDFAVAVACSDPELQMIRVSFWPRFRNSRARYRRGAR